MQIFLSEIAEISAFAWRFLKECVKPPYEPGELIKQSFMVGYKSLPLVTVTAFIMGMVLTVQSAPTLKKFGAEAWLPAMVSVSIVREIAPVLTALIFAGKVGSGIGAELASMRVTEQIDAMEVSAVNPFKYLVTTKIIACVTMVPVLVVFADAISLYGSYVGINLNEKLSLILFFSQALDILDFTDVFPSIFKSFFFGGAIGLVSCYYGYHAGPGTEGVGKAANSAVITASLAVFILDMIAVQVTSLFLKIW